MCKWWQTTLAFSAISLIYMYMKKNGESTPPSNPYSVEITNQCPSFPSQYRVYRYEGIVEVEDAWIEGDWRAIIARTVHRDLLGNPCVEKRLTEILSNFIETEESSSLSHVVLNIDDVFVAVIRVGRRYNGDRYAVLRNLNRVI